MIESNYPDFSILRQYELDDFNRATYYWRAAEESELNLRLMEMIDRENTQTPYYGYRKMTVRMNKQLEKGINHKRMARLMQKMGLQAIYPRKKPSKSNQQHKIYPYLLRHLEFYPPNQDWAADITYFPIRKGFNVLGGGYGLVKPLFDQLAIFQHWKASFVSLHCGRLISKGCQIYSKPIRVHNSRPIKS